MAEKFTPVSEGRLPPTVSPRLRLCLAAAALAAAPIVFVAWQAFLSVRNAPFEDEFGTVLDFLLRYRATHSFHGLIALLFDQSNEHRIVTSRLIFIAMQGLFGGANFIAISVLGNLFIIGAIAVVAWQERTRAMRLLVGSTLCLLVFQMQHYENLFLSYASIDHFHVVLLAAGSLALLCRTSVLSFVAAVGLAILAAFTLVHGLAVFPAGAILLFSQRRRLPAIAWLLCAAIVLTGYLWGLDGYGRPLPALLSSHGLPAMADYWLALLGGLPALGSLTVAPWFGACALAAALFALRRGCLRKDPFLSSLLFWVIGSTVLIAYGRFTVAAVPALSSRYMIQSALLWGILGIFLVKALARTKGVAKPGFILLAAATAFSVAADFTFFERAQIFLNRRNAAIDYYERRGSLFGSPYSIYPDPEAADRVLAATRVNHVFRLEPRSSPEVRLSVRVEENRLDNSIDELTVGTTHVFIRGWVLPPLGQFTTYTPHLILMAGGKEYVFRGEQVDRPDVAKQFQRPSAEKCGFSFAIPRSALPPTEMGVSLAIVGWGGGLKTDIVSHFSNGSPSLALR